MHPLQPVIEQITSLIRFGPDMSQWTRPAGKLLESLESLPSPADVFVQKAEKDLGTLSQLRWIRDGGASRFEGPPRYGIQLLRRDLDDLVRSDCWIKRQEEGKAADLLREEPLYGTIVDYINWNGWVPRERFPHPLGRRFLLDSLAVEHFFHSLRTLRESLRPEDGFEDNVLALLRRFQGRTEALKEFTDHLGAGDYILSVHCELHTASEWLAMTEAGRAWYERLGLKPFSAGHIIHGWQDPRREGDRLFRRPIGGSPYSLEIWPGLNEARSGLEFWIATGTQDPVIQVGVRLGPDFVAVTLVQGVQGVYLDHRERLRQALHGMDPFNWIIEGVATAAGEAGLSELRGYSYWCNGWIRRAFERGYVEGEGERRWFTIEDIPRLRRMYDDRFTRLGMHPMPGREDLFARPLSTGKERPWVDPTGIFPDRQLLLL